VPPSFYFDLCRKAFTRMKKSPLHYLLALGFLLLPISYYPFSGDSESSGKWGVLYILTALLLAITLGSWGKPTKIPRSKTLFGFLGLFATCYLFSILVNLPGAYENQILDWTCFVTVAMLSYAIFSREKDTLILIGKMTNLATGVVLGYAAIKAFQNQLPYSSLYLKTLSAEFLAISLLFQTSGLHRKIASAKKLPKIISLAVPLSFLVITAAYLASLKCSPISLALLGALTPLTFAIWKPRTKWIPITVAAVSLVAFAPPSPLLTGNQLTRWKNTVTMIQSHLLLGVGPGNYEFEYIPFSHSQGQDLELTEHTVVKSPRNGYLQAAAQGGILLLLTVMSALFWIGRFLWMGFHKGQKSKEQPVFAFISSVYVFLVIDAFFGFPMENAFLIYVIAVLGGLAATTGKPVSFTVETPFKWALFAPLLLGITYFGFLFHYTKTIELWNMDSYPKVSFACEHFPSNWKVCLRKSELEIASQNYKEAAKTSQSLLDKNPLNFPALQLGSIASANQGNYEESCRLLKSYDTIFELHSSVHAMVVNNCRSGRTIGRVREQPQAKP
jgi:hypothetical protein